jgi:uncharacterized protein (DUF169 family)
MLGPEARTMYWQAWSDRLTRELELDTHPVAVSMGGPLGCDPSQGKVSVCQALQRAARGQTIWVTTATSGCAGGLVSLGLGQTAAEGRERLVDFLVEREKVYCSRVAMHRGRESVPPPVGLGSHVAFAPLRSAEVLPDLVVFLGRPRSLQHLLGLANYWEGGPLRAELAGPACRTVVAYPLVTGEVGLSLLDHGARRLADFGPDELAVAVPLPRMLGIMHALAQGVGRGRVEDREQMERQIDELGKVDPT